MIKQLAVLALVGATFSVEAAISVVGTEVAFGVDGTQNTMIKVPENTKGGDLLVLAIHRTDDFLPIEIGKGWTRVAECFKTGNPKDCARVEDCVDKSSNGKYCEEFGGGKKTEGDGQDLAEVIYVKKAACNEQSSYSFRFRTGKEKKKASWFLMTALRGADILDPVRDWTSRGNDGNHDSLFPRVTGSAGDYLLLFQSYDDPVNKSGLDFRAPQGMSTLGFITGRDETGYIYGRVLRSSDLSDGKTSQKKTQGPGGFKDKDALISMTIKPATSSPESCENDNKKCNSGSWTGLRKQCDDCFALVSTSEAPTCKEFCQKQGLTCVAAFEDIGNSCTEFLASGITCETNFINKFKKTSDMLCECGTSPKTISTISGREQPYTDSKEQPYTDSKEQSYTDSKEGNVFDEYTLDVDSREGVSAAVLTTAGIVPLLATVAGHFIFC